MLPPRGRGRAGAVAAVVVTVSATAVFAVGAVGKLIGTALADVPTVWDQSLVDVGYFAAGQTLLILAGSSFSGSSLPGVQSGLLR